MKLSPNSLGKKREAELIIRENKLPTVIFKELSISELGGIPLSNEEKELPNATPTQTRK